ncbi:PAS domain-containing sensor histidine kinase [Hymenobacter cavernae]|uniref:histidine kinase n=1 Tax=Hymenobacter cavernae TaxID=2044852 RepID=A0ABQ1UNT9_9BACT|nr:PAS domain-containing protein [Hymenobacter cavernae]GGF22559.1 hypothetical protein GCM10011383_37730 [Hymenobacter cavernae]
MSAAVVPLTDLFAPADWLTLLDVSLTGIHLVRPVYVQAGADIVDFAVEYLNPAAQRMMSFAEQPGGTLLTHFPHAVASGIFTYYRRVFESGETLTYQAHYQTDGLDNYFEFCARRSGEHLIVSINDTANQPRGAIKQNLGGSRMHKPQVLAEAEQQRAALQRIFAQAPVAMGLLRGPNLVVEWANARMGQIWGRPLEQVLGHPYFEALPDFAGQGFEEVLAAVLATGQSYEQQEQPVDITQAQQRYRSYLNITYLPDYDAQGQCTGILIYANDVTEQVRAHRQIQQLNQELETRVEERTQAALALQADARAVVRQRVAEREAFYQVFESIPAAVSLLRGLRHRFEYINPVYQQVFAGRLLLGLDFAQALPDAEEQGYLALLDRVYQTGETFFGAELPFVSVRPDRPPQTLYFNFTYQAIWENGQVVGISSFAFDVTEQVRARQQAEALQAQMLAEREAQQRQLQAVFAQAPVAMGLYQGEQHCVVMANNLLCAMWGCAPEQVLGRSLLEGVPALQGQGFTELIDEVARTRVPFVGTEVPVRQDRQEKIHYYNFIYQPLYDDAGALLGVLDIATDVTALVQARRMVEEREESFRLMADHAPAMLWVTNPDGQCTYLNQPWYDYTGQTEAEALGLGWTGAVHPEDAPGAGATFLDANTRREPFHCLYRLRRHDGVYRWTLDSGLPRFMTDGTYAGIVGTVIDVHEQKLAELARRRLTRKLRKARDEAQARNVELSTAVEQLQRTNADLDNFIYTASHDLKQPIVNIEGLLLALQHELPATSLVGEVQTLLTFMQDAIERFGRTIGHLTDISRLQKEHNHPVVDVNLARVVGEVVLDLTPLIVETGARVAIEVPKAVVLAFAEKNLRSVLYNLLSNALKYRHPERVPQVRIMYQAQEAYHVLAVHDNGLGMDLTQGQEKLFAMFQRLHTHVEGSGIGLYMVKKMVENVRGRIEVQSQLNQGSTFLVYFPR